MNRSDEKLSVFVRLAADLAQLSRCVRRSVGCVIIPPDFTEVLAIGYNGPPAGVSNDRCRSEQGACGCTHSEANALVKLSTHRSGLILVTTMAPCEQCAGLILNSKRIAEVVYDEPYRVEDGLTLLAEGGIRVKRRP